MSELTPEEEREVERLMAEVEPLMGGEVPATNTTRKLMESKVRAKRSPTGRVPAGDKMRELFPGIRSFDDYLADTLRNYLYGVDGSVEPHCSHEVKPDSTGDGRCEKCHKALELLALIERDA